MTDGKKEERRRILQWTKLRKTPLLVAIYRQFANKITATFQGNEHLYIFLYIENENKKNRIHINFVAYGMDINMK